MTTKVSNTTTYPWDTVVHIIATYSNGQSFGGSGVIVGNNDILTATHMVYNPSAGGAATKVEIIPAQNGSTLPFGIYYGAKWYYNSGINPSDGLYQSEVHGDLAIIGLNTSLGDTTGWMGIDPNFSSGTVNITGYPEKYGNTTMSTSSGYVYATSGILDTSSLDINPGNSGGPLWETLNGEEYVVGVVSTAPWGAPTSGSWYDQIVQWMSQDDSLLPTPTPSATLAVNGSISSSITQSTSAQQFSITLTAGHKYIFNMEGTATNNGTLPDPKLTLDDSSNNQVSTDDNSGIGLNATIVYTPQQTGNYVVVANSATSGQQGSFQLSATDGNSAPYASPWFDQNYYLSSKAAQLNAASYQGGGWTADSLNTLLQSIGMTPLQHYKAYGAFESGVSPSAQFNDATYDNNKAIQLNDALYQGRTNWTGADFSQILKSIGLTPIEHYLAYGASEGVTPA